MMSPPTIYAEVAYFSSVVGQGDYCAEGGGRIWGLDYNGLTAGTTDDTEGRLDADGNELTLGYVEYLDYLDSTAAGLQLIQRPSCYQGVSDFEPYTGTGYSEGAQPPIMGEAEPQDKVGGTTDGQSLTFLGATAGATQLTVQTGETGVSSPEMNTPEGGGSITTGKKAVVPIATPPQAVFSMSWGLLFD